MTKEVNFTPAADDDLDRLYSYVLERSELPDIAIGYVRRIRRVCERLAFFPERGTRREDLGDGIRVMGFEHRVTVAFRLTGPGVEIVRILYGGRQLRPDLFAE